MPVNKSERERSQWCWRSKSCSTPHYDNGETERMNRQCRKDGGCEEYQDRFGKAAGRGGEEGGE